MKVKWILKYKNLFNIVNFIEITTILIMLFNLKRLKTGMLNQKIIIKIKWFNLANRLNKNQIQLKIFKENFIPKFNEKFGPIDFGKEYNALNNNEINIDENKLDSYKKILNEKLNISHYIKIF